MTRRKFGRFWVLPIPLSAFIDTNFVTSIQTSRLDDMLLIFVVPNFLLLF
ncbi:MAG: hypothetical protein RJB13_1897 [Pseudomonadota bacterium]